MAVTLFAANFIHPEGELQPVMFPKENLGALLDAWISQATSKVAGVAASEQDNAAAAWVYYRAYSTIARRIGASPSSHSSSGTGGVETTVNWGQNRADYWEELAQQQLDRFEYYVPPAPTASQPWSVGWLNLDYIEAYSDPGNG